MGNPIAILNGDQIYLDELIRENARLTIQHEADHQRILELTDLVETLEEDKALLTEQLEKLREDVEDNLAYAAADAKRVKELNVDLSRAIADLHFVMAGGDPCKVCTVKCAFGEGTCKPVWRGEETEEAADQ